jgi:hypothetical protein
MRNSGWEKSLVTEPLRKQISEYVEAVIEKEVPRIPFNGYQQFINKGSRKEFEAAYFGVRKQLTALGLYLQWNPSKKAITYFNELLWSVSNEFSWCLAAHLSYGEKGFLGEPDKVIDLFSAETAQTLSELLILHEDIMEPYIQEYLRKRIDERVLTPFLEHQWGWETSINNWCAVCASSVGMAALQLAEGEKKAQILDRVDKALVYYLKCFGDDGASEEGIGYWVYGFGYYIYYIAMRMEMDKEFHLSAEIRDKVKQIAEFPHFVQITQNSYLPFSDASVDTLIPTGLLSYLYKEFGAEPPQCCEITSFDFEHCYRFAHISRNLWWTESKIFHYPITNMVKFFEEKQWLLQRTGACFFAVKGGNNKEEHNHNDVGSFIIALDGELFLTDLGAGPYTADYFGEKRYQCTHTRSYWHNIPIIQEMEQILTENQCSVKALSLEKDAASIDMELDLLYKVPMLKSFRRKLTSNAVENSIILEDRFISDTKISIEEGFISSIKPTVMEEGIVEWEGSKGKITLFYDSSALICKMEEKQIADHMNNSEMVYRIGLEEKNKADEVVVKLKFSFIYK